LNEVARRCLQVMREVDVVARYGGEEFIVLLPETILEGAAQAAERMKVCITGHPIVVGERQVEISVSIGAAEIDERCLTWRRCWSAPIRRCMQPSAPAAARFRCGKTARSEATRPI